MCFQRHVINQGDKYRCEVGLKDDVPQGSVEATLRHPVLTDGDSYDLQASKYNVIPT